ncbi:MAG: acyloxyacyl hydrolase [Candidatus Omnitrophota bacterium]
MKGNKHFWTPLVLMILTGMLAGALPASAERPEHGIGKWLQEVGVFAGYTKSGLKYQGDLEAIPVGMRFGFDLKPFLEKFGWSPKGMFEVMYEAFISTIYSPRDNVELGASVFLKYSYPLTSRLFPFIEIGSGPYYMTLSTYEQSTQFNFISQGGAGLTYFLKKDLAVNVEYRRRHVSNASIKSPNAGIDGDVYLLGLSLYF